MFARDCISRSLASALIALLSTLPSARGGDSGKRFALLIGANRYDNRNLANLEYAERDVEELSQFLKDGYQVQLLLGTAAQPKKGATKANIEAALNRLFRSELTKDDLVLIAFAGHGQQLTVQRRGQKHDEPFFCPCDARPGDPATMINLSRLIERLGERGAGTNLLLVDACRNDPDPTRGRGIDGDVALNLPSGMAAFFSCSKGERAQESAKAGGGHGLFFHFVLEALRSDTTRNSRGELRWEQLVGYVKDKLEVQGPNLLGRGAPAQTPHELANLTRSPIILAANTLRHHTPARYDRWTYRNDQGEAYFKHTAGKDWVEVKPDGRIHFYFKEVQRNNEYVELYDSTRPVWVRLYANKSVLKSANTKGQWLALFKGSWTTAAR